MVFYFISSLKTSHIGVYMELFSERKKKVFFFNFQLPSWKIFEIFILP